MFKILITFLPVLIAIGYFGYIQISKYKYLHIAFCTCLVLSWFVGVKIYADGTFAGPGFELSAGNKSAGNSKIKRNPDSRIKINKILPAFEGGFYLPMPEGPRPLYGYYYALFGGEWTQNVQRFTNDRARVVNLLEKHEGHKYLQDGKNYYILCDLYKKGYSTKMNFKTYNSNLLYRDFLKGNDTIRIFAIDDQQPKAEVARYFVDSNKKVVFRSSYSNLILSLSQQNPKLKLLGPFALEKTETP